MRKSKENIFLMLSAVFLVVGLVVAGYWFLQVQKMRQNWANEIRSSQDNLIKNEVQTAVSVLREIYNRAEKGEYPVAEAKRRGANLLRGMKYGEDGYFWVDTTEGLNIVLYGNKVVEGKNRLNDKINGLQYVKMIIANGQNSGGGFTDFFYPKKGGTLPWAKRSYSLYFKPFNWVVGTGYYPDDVERTIKNTIGR